MTTFKRLTSRDVIDSRTLLHEAIPITGSILSGTYSDANIKEYAHGIFQSVYDYPYLSSSANHIFDITVGYSNQSALPSSTNEQNSKKINIYNQMAQVLVGYDSTGSIGRFDLSGSTPGTGDEVNKINDTYFVNFSRLLTKDEIKKGTFNLQLGVSGSATYQEDGTNFSHIVKIYDKNGNDKYFSNAQVGEYGVLYAASSAGGSLLKTEDTECGLVFYQAGLAMISSSVFLNDATGGILTSSLFGGVLPKVSTGNYDVTASFISSSINNLSDGLRNRIYNIQFSNTTELNSAIYFCRINHNEFNYSSNPTYLTESRIRVKDVASDAPITYITSVGLYSDNNELLAVGKLSEPLKKTPENEITLRVRLDY
jgi:hypothetical protein